MSDSRNIALVLRWLPACLWAGFIFFMSSRPGSDLAPSGLFGAVIEALNGVQVALFGADLGLATPFLHFCEYALLALLVVWPLSALTSPRSAALIALAIASLYGATDEWHQWFVPGRACDPLDWVVDPLGAACVGLIWYIVSTRAGKRSKGGRT